MRCVPVALCLSLAVGCGDDGGDGGAASTDGASGTAGAGSSSGGAETSGGELTSSGATTGAQDSGTGTGTTGAPPEPPACEPVACPDGELGCPCGSGCAAGTCEQGTCVLETDGMVRVPAGPFCRGCLADRDEGCISHESPPHTVVVSAFDIDRHEVTQAQWAACVDAGMCPVPNAERTCINRYDPETKAQQPIVCVEWTWARDYCAWLGKRLPTEAEWEKAARGVAERVHPWGDGPYTCELANYGRDGEECIDDTTPVGSYPGGASPYGALDMGGNVWERVADFYQPDWYARPEAWQDDPGGPAEGTARVMRGGSFTSDGKFMRTSARDGSLAEFVTQRNVGFRCARDVGS